MRLGTAILELSQLLQRTDSTTFGEAELGAYLHRHVLSLQRKMAEVDAGYFNHVLQLPLAQARQFKSDAWEYTLPPWVERIVEVRQSLSTTTPTTAALGGTLPQIHKFETRGWRRNGPSTLHLKGFMTALDLELTVCKRAARPTKGTLPTQANLTAPALRHVRIDADTTADALLHPHETLTDSYANAIIEITGNHARSGQYRRVVGSTHFQDEAGTRYTVLEVESDWTVQPAAADTYEMHLEIPEQHAQLVLLLAAHSAYGTRGNSDEQKAMAGLVANEMAEFQRHITPADVHHPRHLRHSVLPISSAPARTEDTQRPLWV